MTVKQLLDDLGFAPTKEGLKELLQECEEEGGVAYPALCDEGCFVEPDGCCPHGKVSVLVRASLL